MRTKLIAMSAALAVLAIPATASAHEMKEREARKATKAYVKATLRAIRTIEGARVLGSGVDDCDPQSDHEYVCDYHYKWDTGIDTGPPIEGEEALGSLSALYCTGQLEVSYTSSKRKRVGVRKFTPEDCG